MKFSVLSYIRCITEVSAARACPVAHPFGQLLIPSHQRQGLHSGQTIRNGTAEYRESTLRRNQAFQYKTEFPGTFQGAVIIFFIMNTSVFPCILHALQRFQIHGMEDITAIIVESERRAVRIPAISRVPFLHLAESRIYTICILSGINFGKEAFNGGREQQPVSVRRVNASETFELFM